MPLRRRRSGSPLYGRFLACLDCREEYDDSLTACPTCRSGRHAVEDRRGRLPAMVTLTYPGDCTRLCAVSCGASPTTSDE